MEFGLRWEKETRWLADSLRIAESLHRELGGQVRRERRIEVAEQESGEVRRDLQRVRRASRSQTTDPR